MYVFDKYIQGLTCIFFSADEKDTLLDAAADTQIMISSPRHTSSKMKVAFGMLL